MATDYKQRLAWRKKQQALKNKHDKEAAQLIKYRAARPNPQQPHLPSPRVQPQTTSEHNSQQNRPITDPSQQNPQANLNQAPAPTPPAQAPQAGQPQPQPQPPPQNVDPGNQTLNDAAGLGAQTQPPVQPLPNAPIDQPLPTGPSVAKHKPWPERDIAPSPAQDEPQPQEPQGPQQPRKLQGGLSIGQNPKSDRPLLTKSERDDKRRQVEKNRLAPKPRDSVRDERLTARNIGLEKKLTGLLGQQKGSRDIGQLNKIGGQIVKSQMALGASKEDAEKYVRGLVPGEDKKAIADSREAPQMMSPQQWYKTNYGRMTGGVVNQGAAEKRYAHYQHLWRESQKKKKKVNDA